MDLIKITPNKETVQNMLKIISLIEQRIKIQDKKLMTSLIIVDYYEIVKELLTALLILDGYKTLSHKDLLAYLKKYYPSFETNLFFKLDNLRILRNRVSYDGLNVEVSYLERNERDFIRIISWLKKKISSKL